MLADYVATEEKEKPPQHTFKEWEKSRFFRLSAFCVRLQESPQATWSCLIRNKKITGWCVDVRNVFRAQIRAPAESLDGTAHLIILSMLARFTYLLPRFIYTWTDAKSMIMRHTTTPTSPLHLVEAARNWLSVLSMPSARPAARSTRTRTSTSFFLYYVYTFFCFIFVCLVASHVLSLVHSLLCHDHFYLFPFTP